VKECLLGHPPATTERKWRGRHMINWLDQGGVNKRRHATLVLERDALPIPEQERSNELPGGERTGAE
jgi:hypothetical protein